MQPSPASVRNIGLSNSQDFKKKPLSEGPPWAHVAGTAPTLTCTDLARSQGKAGNELPWVSDFPVHTMVPWLLPAPSAVGHPVGRTSRKKLLSFPIIRVVV